MGERTKIPWCHHTFNGWRGCEKVSAGCANCYAEAMSKRNPQVLGIWGRDGTRVVAADAYWKQPLRWDKAAAAAGARRRVFASSLCDVFEDRPDLVAPRQRLWELIDRTPNLDWIVLTKRPQNIRRLCPAVYTDWPNIWWGTSVESQDQEWRIDELLKIQAAVRLVSLEPLLGPIDLDRFTCGACGGSFSRSENRKALKVCCPHCGHGDEHTGPDILPWLGGSPSARYTTAWPQLDWVIVGGESGPRARPCNVEWIRSIVSQCRDADVACFMKQLGADPYLSASWDGEDLPEWPVPIEWSGHGCGTYRPLLKHPKGGDPSEWPEDLRVREVPQT